MSKTRERLAEMEIYYHKMMQAHPPHSDYFKYLKEMTEEWTGIISGGKKMNTCSYCKPEFEKYEIINGELFCPECGWEKEFAEKQTASKTDALNQESPQKPKSDKDHKKPASKILSDSAIKRQLLADAIQYPATLASLAIFGTSIVYLAVLSPVMGKALWAVIPLIISGITATISFILRYNCLCNTEYPKKIKQMMEDRERKQIFQEKASTKKRRAELLAGFGNMSYAEGLRAITNLSEQYEQLQATLASHRETDPYTVTLFSGLIVETYKQGLSVLSDAWDMAKTVHSSDLRLKKEFVDLEKEIADLNGKEKESERLRIKKETLSSHKQRLELLDQLQLHVEQLLYQAGLCEASLHRTRIELSTLRAQGSEGGIKKLTETLEETIQDVKEAQEELRRLEK